MGGEGRGLGGRGSVVCVVDSVVDQQVFPVIDGTTLCVCDR